MLFKKLRERIAQNHVTAFMEAAVEHGQTDVSNALNAAVTANIPWLKIAGVLLPFITQLINHQSIDWKAVLTAILGLVPTQTPAASAP